VASRAAAASVLASNSATRNSPPPRRAVSRDDGAKDLLVGDMLRTNELQERR
jgi:hypothetical protein